MINVNSNYNYSYQFIKAYFEELYSKVETLQPLLTAGDNITISDGVISATDTTYTAGKGISISEQNIISTDEDLTPLAYIEYNETDDEINTSKPIIENIPNLSATSGTVTNLTKTDVYAGAAKNGNKLTFAYAFEATRTDTVASGSKELLYFNIPAELWNKLYVVIGSLTLSRSKYLASNLVNSANDKELIITLQKTQNNTVLITSSSDELNKLTLDQSYYIRFEVTFLLSDNLVS